MSTSVKSPSTYDISQATDRLSEATKERWMVNWDDQTIECVHGVRLPHWSALATSTETLAAVVATRHDGRRPRPFRSSRLQLVA